MAFNFSRLLDIVKIISGTKTFEKAANEGIRKIGERIDENAHNPTAVKEIAGELIREAPAIVGAIVKGTEAQNLVDPATIHHGKHDPVPQGSGSTA